jgi:hypothetical protein
VVPNTALEVGNQRTTGTVQFVDNLSYNRGAHAFKFGTNLRFVKHDDLRGSIAGANVTEIIDFDRLVNTIDPATFGLPADINLSNDRPELERNINFLLGRVGRVTRGFASNGSSYVADITASRLASASTTTTCRTPGRRGAISPSTSDCAGRSRARPRRRTA